MWLLTSAALAADPVWGVGGHLGTSFLPGAYPLAFPPKVTEYDFDDDTQDLPDDVTGDGLADVSTIEKVRSDLGFGFDGYYWLGSSYRLGLTTHFDFGARFSDVSGIVLFERSIDLGRAYLLFGGGLGFANTVWRGEDEDERLKIPNYPFRAQVGPLVPVNDWVGLGGTVFAQMGIPSRHLYTDIAGNEQEVAGVPFTYVTLGVQISGVYGQLR